MFHIIGTDLHNYLPSSFKFIICNYTEAGHGKGALDGIGDTVKRTADKIISTNKDIPHVKAFMELVPTEIEEYNIPNNIPTYKGTLKVRQVIRNLAEPNMLHFRNVSCYKCNLGNRCLNYQLPSYHLKDLTEEQGDCIL
ncbi:unnamed protein product [Psylliodes chrysocephalus]|uniref:Uncharacterized protein n=1 Tax=Psylliodes chrysocephalus TaxID=3402493 RepID=A0A9P0CEB4_9CUCU|nr:unnamed protein product [Psylliodes chrysocephala]